MSSETKYNIKAIIIFLVIIEVIVWPVFFSLKYYLEQNDESFRFEHPGVLWWLLFIPVYLIFTILRLHWRNKNITKFGDLRIIGKISNPVSSFIAGLSTFLIRMSVFSFIIALSNPQYGKGTRTAKSEGVDIMLAIDVSNSMLTTDASNQWSRIKRSKLDIERLINKMTGDRLGIIAFAGIPVVQLPMTADLAAAKFFTSGINTDMISIQGTNISSAIELAISSFPQEAKRERVLIIITDGEDHDANAVMLASAAAQQNITVHTIGIGSTKGAPVPVYENGKYKGLKRDKDGNTVISKLNEKLLIDIANAGQGVYVNATNDVSPLEIVREEIAKMEKTEVESIDYPEYEDRFQLFLGIAICLLLIELIIPSKSIDLFSKIIHHAN